MILHDLRDEESVSLGEITRTRTVNGLLSSEQYMEVDLSLGYRLLLREEECKQLLKALRGK